MSDTKASMLSMFLYIIKQELLGLIRPIRNRCRCPKCKAVGTYKPHGYLTGNSRESGRRWLCKWCGYYYGLIDGKFKERAAFIDPDGKCWRIEDWYEEIPVDAYTPREKLENANPFFG